MSSDKTSLGDRMKGQYESRTQTHLPRRTYTIIRLDGKAFHTYTRGCDKPYDLELSVAMTDAAAYLCAQVQGAKFAYVQSDEVSLLLTDFATNQTDAWFDGNVQKMVSVAASTMTAMFNRLMDTDALAVFDARVFTIPDRTEVENYFIWRQQDCVRNSISGLAQAHFSHKQLHGVNTDKMQEMLWSEKGISWAEEKDAFKNGVVVRKLPTGLPGRSEWMSDAAPTWTQERDELSRLIPSYE